MSYGEANEPFALGVASGDPDHQSVILWTRLTGTGSTVDENILWEISKDPSFTEIVASGSSTALVKDASSCSVLASGLASDSWYFFRFSHGSNFSPVGRTRTMPAPGTTPESFTLIAASCQDYQRGEFAAHQSIAASEADLLVFLGDFIYASPTKDFGGRSHDSLAPKTLVEFRSRYELYLSDASLRAARASLPWVVIWDDNEVKGNYAGPVEEAEDAYKAWFEHLPTRLRTEDTSSTQIYRSVHAGDLFEILLLDGRQYRSPQVCEADSTGATADCPERHDSTRSMLGSSQEEWLGTMLSSSTARWQIVAQQTMVTPLEFSLGTTARYNNDQWDGYPAARDRLVSQLETAPSPVVLSGDLHAGAVATISKDVCAEFVTPSISSSLTELTALGLELAAAFQPQVQHLDASRRGYLSIQVSQSALNVKQLAVRDPWDPKSPVIETTRWILPYGASVPELQEEVLTS